MPKTFMMKLDRIQPTQLFISSEKLSEVMKTFDATNPASMEPIPIKRLKNKIVFVDGHTRALAAFLHGFSHVPVYWEDEELDWDAYEVCLEWCEKEGIRTIADLKDRVISIRIMRSCGMNVAKECRETWRGGSIYKSESLRVT